MRKSNTSNYYVILSSYAYSQPQAMTINGIVMFSDTNGLVYVTKHRNMRHF